MFTVSTPEELTQLRENLKNRNQVKNVTVNEIFNNLVYLDTFQVSGLVKNKVYILTNLFSNIHVRHISADCFEIVLTLGNKIEKGKEYLFIDPSY